MSSESTPLLPSIEAANGRGPSYARVPALLPTLASLSEGRHLTLSELYHTLPIQAISRPQKTAFVLVSLLHLLIHSQAALPLRHLTTWEQWNHVQATQEDTDVLQRLITEAWEMFIDRAEDEELEGEDSVETMLWYQVPLDDLETKTVRVVDLIVHPLAPAFLLNHPLIMISLSRTWTRGKTRSVSEATSMSGRFFSRIDAISTPRVSYTVALFFHVLYIISLINLVLAPPTSPIFIAPRLLAPVIGTRELGLMVYSASLLLYFERSYILCSIPPFLTLAAILLSLPHAPTPNTMPHNLLLLSLSWSLFQLHIPSPPSPPTPLYILSPEKALPIATLIQSLLNRSVVPALKFFSPIFITLTILVGIALSDTFPIFATVEMFFMMSAPAHPQTRLTLILLFLLTGFAYFCFLYCLILLFPTLPDPDTCVKKPWDRYSTKIGLVARRNFIKVLIAHSARLTLPPPLNGLYIVFVAIPVKFLKTISRPSAARNWESSVGLGIWRSTVGIVGILVAGFYGWKRR